MRARGLARWSGRLITGRPRVQIPAGPSLMEDIDNEKSLPFA